MWAELATSVASLLKMIHSMVQVEVLMVIEVAQYVLDQVWLKF
jgi:hypothetical protein